MAHASHTTVRAPIEPTRKTSTGGLSPWRESLVKKVILDGLSDTLEITELAKACALSRSHFSRAFKCSTGQSPQAWIRSQRIDRAKQLIRETDLTLTQISLECGFCDQAHFVTSSPTAKASIRLPGGAGNCALSRTHLVASSTAPSPAQSHTETKHVACTTPLNRRPEAALAACPAHRQRRTGDGSGTRAKHAWLSRRGDAGSSQPQLLPQQ